MTNYVFINPQRITPDSAVPLGFAELYDALQFVAYLVHNSADLVHSCSCHLCHSPPIADGSF